MIHEKIVHSENENRTQTLKNKHSLENCQFCFPFFFKSKWNQKKKIGQSSMWCDVNTLAYRITEMSNFQHLEFTIKFHFHLTRPNNMLYFWQSTHVLIISIWNLFTFYSNCEILKFGQTFKFCATRIRLRFFSLLNFCCFALSVFCCCCCFI